MRAVRAWVEDICDRLDITGAVALVILVSLFAVGVFRARSALMSKSHAGEVTSVWRSHIDGLDCPALATEKGRLAANVDSDAQTRAAFDYAGKREALLHF